MHDMDYKAFLPKKKSLPESYWFSQLNENCHLMLASKSQVSEMQAAVKNDTEEAKGAGTGAGDAFNREGDGLNKEKNNQQSSTVKFPAISINIEDSDRP